MYTVACLKPRWFGLPVFGDSGARDPLEEIESDGAGEGWYRFELAEAGGDGCGKGCAEGGLEDIQCRTRPFEHETVFGAVVVGAAQGVRSAVCLGAHVNLVARQFIAGGAKLVDLLRENRA